MRIFIAAILLTFAVNSARTTPALQGDLKDGESDILDSSKKEFTPNPQLTISAAQLSGEIKIDGIIEDAWKTHTRFENFTEMRPSENARPAVVTEGYVTFDKEFLYLAFICWDPEISKLRVSLTDRDRIFQDDWVGVIIDTYQNFQTGYELFANPYGVQGDLRFQQNAEEDVSFDAVWYSEGRIFDDHWSLEMKIPFKSLRFPNQKEQSWSMHVIRTYPRDNRYQYSWMPVTENNNSFIGQAGTLTFTLPEVIETRTIEVLPSVVSSQANELLDKNDDDVSKWHHQDPKVDAGVGVKFGLSSTVTLDAALNPDFSQIESDESQISANNTFALFFPEKRPFFLEGADIFNVNSNTRLIYSRSINNPLGATKITGKTGKLTFGYTSAYDQNTPYIIPFSESSAVLATNKNSFSNFFRAKYDVADQSYVGILATHHKLDEKGSNAVVTADANIRLSDKHSFGAVVGMSVTTEPNDADLSEDIRDGVVDTDTTFKTGGKLRTSAFDGERFNGFLARAVFERQSRNWEWWFVYEDFSPGFRAENGFIRSNNSRSIFPGTEYAFRFDKHPVFHTIEVGIDSWRKYDYDGNVKDTGARPFIWLGMRKQTGVFISAFLYNREFYRGKQFEDARSVWLEFDTDMYNKLSGGFFVMAGRQINRGGEEGNDRDPFEIVPAVRFNLWSNFHPVSQLDNRLEFQSISLWTDWGSDVIASQKIVRNTLSYQFTRRLFLRLIGEYIVRDEYDSDEGKLVKSESYSIDPLLSYKINPFTVFFVGANFGGEKDPFPDRDGLIPTAQLFFVKFQYFMRV